MASRALFGILVIVLSISHIMTCSKAVPITRTESLMRANLPQDTTNGLIWDEQTHVTKHAVARMDIELNDYPGSGANNRHTPRAQFGRCLDC